MSKRQPFVDQNDSFSYENWMNAMGEQEAAPEMPPFGHPLRQLGVRLTELLDEDHFAECERLLLEGWAYDEIDRKTGAAWREDSSLQVWFPITAEVHDRMIETLRGIAEADWGKWEELASPDEFVRWAKARAINAIG